MTLVNLALGLDAVTVVVIGTHGTCRPVVGLVALVLWQIAYSLDCADGQLPG